MNKRDAMLSLLQAGAQQTYYPAAFFLHFDPAYHQGQAAIEKHLEFFRYTGMDFVKIQYEHPYPRNPEILRPADWKKITPLKKDYFEIPLRVVEGLVRAARKEALVLVTLYSPLMCAGQINGQETITRHLSEDPESVRPGMEAVTESVLQFVRGCIHAGVDGFYASTQGAETFRFQDPQIFLNYVKPFDLQIMQEINQRCQFNILHICDYHGSYHDLSPFLDYPGQVVNCSLKLTEGELSSQQVFQFFKRPYMGGMDRHGVIASGSLEEIRRTATTVLQAAPERFILAADCTVPSETPWENLKAAIQTAHQFNRSI